MPCGTSPLLLSTGTLSAERLSLSVHPSVPTAVSVSCLRGQCPVSERAEPCPSPSHQSGSVTADPEGRKQIHQIWCTADYIKMPVMP